MERMLPVVMKSERGVAIFAACCWFFVGSLRCEAQGNLIPNPSFEDADTCAVQLGYLPDGVPQNWFPVSDTPDYFRTCVPYGSPNGVPVNTFGYQAPQDGDAYSGMFAHLVDDHREMIAAELTETLTVGQTYYGSFWANAAYGGPQQTGSGSNNTGMLFTMEVTPWLSGMTEFGLRNYAQVYSPEVIADTSNWTLVSGVFTADSAYRYVVFGNHFNNASTTLQLLGPGVAAKAYILVDAICLSTDPNGCPMNTSFMENMTESIGIWPNPATSQVRIRGAEGSVGTVRDAQGRIIWKKEISTSGNAIEVGTWARGVYVLELVKEKVHSMLKFVLVGE
ncbi:MAG: T9SS type A sorting domain-containing protein [Flavobacteriales bacterium]